MIKYQHYPDNIILPNYDPNELDIGIVHFGLGNFARAHVAYYTELAINHYFNTHGKTPSWGICGVSLRSPTIRDELQQQDFFYTLNECYDNEINSRLIGCIRDIAYAKEDRDKLLNYLLDAHTITITATEKAYYYHPANKNLIEHEDILHDVKNLSHPRTLLGWLATTLLSHFQANTTPPQIISCDNLAENGNILKHLMFEFSQKLDTQFADWLNKCVQFPCTMVDRITPKVTAEDVLRINQHLSQKDDYPIITEPFSQWVIDNKIDQEKTVDWQQAGAELVNNVEDYEKLKLRVLNGAHSALAYLGHHKGYDYIYQCVEDSELLRFINRYFNQIKPTINSCHFDFDHYCQQILMRFGNKAIPYKTTQVAMDGSQKLPQRLLQTLSECYQQNLDCDTLITGVAAWIYYITQTKNNKRTKVSDPHAEDFLNLDLNQDIIDQVLNYTYIFNNELRQNTKFKTQLKLAFLKLKD